MDRRERVFAATSSVETFEEHVRKCGMTNIERIVGLLGLESMRLSMSRSVLFPPLEIEVVNSRL